MAVRYCNDGSGRAPRLRVDVAGGNLWALPAWSTLPREQDAVYAAVKAAGFEGVQGGDVALCAKNGLARTGAGRVDKADEAEAAAKKSKDAGEDCLTLHVGTGFESDEEVVREVDAIINASLKHDQPMYVETHRATVTQDTYRTLQLAARRPGLRFNGDFSHWYTGLEMVYGDFARKLELLMPVFERTAFMHGRIGNPGSMQVAVGDTLDEALAKPFVQHFVQMWSRVFAAFKRNAKPGDFVCFTPELLPASIYYARPLPDREEESDRWEQAKVLAAIARHAWSIE